MISIHAPSRERPFFLPSLPQLRGISIHAPSRERPYGFNVVGAVTFISIHAPSRERPCTTSSINLIVTLFQSTLPRGSDLSKGWKPRRRYYFNPRSLAGATGNIRQLSIISSNFNPRSLAGATRLISLMRRRKQYFNPRSLAGAT